MPTTTTKYTNRTIPRISLADFSTRINDITAQLVHAAETDGFFSLTDTEISIAEIEAMFKTSESFFALPDEVKAEVPFTHDNVGWEKRSQVRPFTGVYTYTHIHPLPISKEKRRKGKKPTLPKKKNSKACKVKPPLTHVAQASPTKKKATNSYSAPQCTTNGSPPTTSQPSNPQRKPSCTRPKASAKNSCSASHAG